MSVRDDGWSDLGECKWGAVKSLPALARELEAKVARYPNPRNATVGFFLRHLREGERPEVPNASWHSLDDLYA